MTFKVAIVIAGICLAIGLLAASTGDSEKYLSKSLGVSLFLSGMALLVVDILVSLMLASGTL